MSELMENAFEALCKRASDEDWCWNIFCTTCGHENFKTAFQILGAGKGFNEKPLTRSSAAEDRGRFQQPAKGLSPQQSKRIAEICLGTDLSAVNGQCKFPDWLGYLGLILHHVSLEPARKRQLSVHWARQLQRLVVVDSPADHRLAKILTTESQYLKILDLEKCERNWSLRSSADI